MADEFRAELGPDSDLRELTDKWLADGWSPINVIQAIRESTDVPLDAAKDLVRGRLDGDRASDLDSVWSEAQQTLGPTLDDTLAAFTDPDSSGLATARDMDFDDARNALAVEQVRAIATDEAVDWLRDRIERIGPTCRPLAQTSLLVMATDALGCPEAMVPTMLQLARWADASQCRYPLAVVRRAHGDAAIDRQIAAMRGGTPAERSKASQWDYWQRADGERTAP
jgi:hypothetical protein